MEKKNEENLAPLKLDLQLIKIIESSTSINSLYLNHSIGIDKLYLITEEDIKLLKFIFIYFLKIQKYKNIEKNLKNDEKNINKNIEYHKILKSNKIIVKFINICIVNVNILANYLNIQKENLNEKIYILIKKLFLNSIISLEDINIIMILKLILCLYKKDTDIKNNKDGNTKNNIKNISEFYSLINFLISFKSNNLNEFHIIKFNKFMEYIVNNIQKIILKDNVNNSFILSKNDKLFKLIELCKISDEQINIIIPLLTNVYINRFNIDYILNDLSEQFVIENNENLINKTNYLISKDTFLYGLFSKEEEKKNEILIKNGFMFNNSESNGIICYLSNNQSKNFPKDGFTLVTSFCLMENEIDKKQIYNIFSFYSTKSQKVILNIYLQNCKLKIFYQGKSYDLFFDILNNKNYVFWMIYSNKEKSNMLLYLNGLKTIFPFIPYPTNEYDEILIGFNKDQNNENIDNFKGIIGTFILFNKCLIKNANDNQNESKLTELKGEYEMIVNINSNRSTIFIDKNLNLILNKYILEKNDISQNIEVIISTRSMGIIDNFDIFKTENDLSFICNYFNYDNLEDNNCYKFKFKSQTSLFNYITYPIETKNSLLEFWNNHGIMYLQLQLFYLIGVLSSKLKSNDLNYSAKDKKEFNFNLTKITSVFFFCINSRLCIIERNHVEIINFLYTLNDLISIYSKHGIKMMSTLISTLDINFKVLISNNLFNFCEFLFEFDYYDLKDINVLEFFFQYLFTLIDENEFYDEKKILKHIFKRIIKFDKVYLHENITKDTKKRYSKLIKRFLIFSLEDNKNVFFDIYLNRLKKIKEDLFQYSLFSWDDENNNIIDLEYNLDTNENKNDSIEFINKKINDLKLIYKYLKNLFVVLDSPNIFENFLALCLKQEKEFSFFFNDLFIYLSQQCDLNLDINNIKSNKIEQSMKLVELIKSLCIQFLDEIFTEKNLNEFKDQKFNKSDTIILSKSQINDKTLIYQNESTNKNERFINNNNLRVNNEINNTSIKKFEIEEIKINEIKRSKTKSIVLTETASSTNSFSSISTNFKNNDFFRPGQEHLVFLFRNFEFLDINNFVLSPYIFYSFYVLLFRKDINNKKKLKTIKNHQKEKNIFYISLNEFPITKYYLELILLLIEKIGDNDNNFNTVFMSKYKLLEFCFDLYNEMLINTLKFYSKENNKKKEDILNYLFTYKRNCFYEIILNIINYFFSSLNNALIINNKEEEFLEDFNIKYKESLKNIINETIFSVKDPFYFIYLNKCFVSDNRNYNFVLEIISYIVVKYISFKGNFLLNYKENQEKLQKLLITELNNKNFLILIHKIFFFIPKRKMIIKDEKFIKNIYIYLSNFMSSSKLLYIKILFPLEVTSKTLDKNNDKSVNKKLISEILFELILEIYLEYVLDTKKIYLQIFEDLMYDLLNIKNLANHKFNKSIMEDFQIHKKKNKINHTFFYILDKLPYKSEKKFKLTDGIVLKHEILKTFKESLFNNYRKEFDEKENIFSVCIIFMIKILISIKNIDILMEKLNKDTFNKINLKSKEKNLENNISLVIHRDNENNIHLKNIFISIFNQLCEDSLKLYKKYRKFNPLSSEGKYNISLYNYYKNYIIKEYSKNRFNDLNSLITRLNDFFKYLIYFGRIIYMQDGSIRLYSFKSYEMLSRVNEKNKSSFINTNDNNNQHSDKINSEDKKDLSNKNLLFSKTFVINPKINFNNISNKSSQNLRLKRNYKKDISLNIDNNNNKESNYILKISFKNDILRIIFSCYFRKLLTYDKDFITIKKLYKYIFKDDLNNIEEFNNFECPQKVKNYISYNYYVKPFFTKDFNFFDHIYFKYSHKYLFSPEKKKKLTIIKTIKAPYKKQASVLFPSKELLYQNDFPSNILINNNSNVNTYFCELIINRGSIFGKILIFKNGILFISDWKNDRRNKKKDVEFACSSLEYDALNEDKRIFILFEEIKQVINRYFCFCWISQEIFMKNGKSYLFNFFTEKKNEEIFDLFKSNKVENIIRKTKEYYDNEEFAKKWKEGLISTYEYLLILNKLCSRTYNDSNQYPVMPWIYLSDKRERNFDLPISLQNEEVKEAFLVKFNNFYGNADGMFHSNHYSTSAYVIFYLMRINPFSNNMIKLQTNDFDVPNRQFSNIFSTLELCEKYNNNRELLPDLFETPEIYYNINYNDFGKLKNKIRIHNIGFEPYAKNGIEFCYDLKNRINNDTKINENINLWIDFIFGVNQWSSNPTENPLRVFNEYTYAQNVNIKKIITESRKKNLEESKIFDEIKNNVGFAMNFGQCPFQILSEVHPKKESNLKTSENKDSSTGIIVEEIYRNKNVNNFKISYFYKNKCQNIICLLKNGFLEINGKNKKNNNVYELIRVLEPKGLINQKIINKYSFCELREELFIFCGYLDKTIKFFYYNQEFSFLLDSYITSIININKSEFITGDSDGKITKWKINIIDANNKNDFILNRICKIKSNNNSITCLEYNEKLNILLSSDNNSVIIRNYYNFSFLAHIKIQNNLNNDNYYLCNIINIKISNSNLIYVLIKGQKMNELHCYTLNGTFCCKTEGYFYEFELTKTGNVIVTDLNVDVDKRKIKILRAYDLSTLLTKSFAFIRNENIFHLHLENQNTLYLSTEGNDNTKIMKVQINRNEEKYFI